MDKPVVLVVVLALDCFPHQPTENEDDHDDDEEIRAFPTIVLVVALVLGLGSRRFTTRRGGSVTQTDKRN